MAKPRSTLGNSGWQETGDGWASSYPLEDSDDHMSVKSWGVVTTRLDVASRFRGESCVGTQSPQLLYTNDTVPDDDPIERKQSRTSYGKLTSLPQERTFHRPQEGSRERVQSSLWPLAQRVTLGKSLKASLGLFPFLRAGWAYLSAKVTSSPEILAS